MNPKRFETICPTSFEIHFCPFCMIKTERDELAVLNPNNGIEYLPGYACKKCKRFYWKFGIYWKKIGELIDSSGYSIDQRFLLQKPWAEYLLTRYQYKSFLESFFLYNRKGCRVITIVTNTSEEKVEDDIFHYKNPCVGHILVQAHTEETDESKIRKYSTGKNYQLPGSKSRGYLTKAMLDGKEYLINRVDESITCPALQAVWKDIEKIIDPSEDVPELTTDTTLYVYNRSYPCDSTHHLIENERASIKGLLNGRTFHVTYCRECKCFYIKKSHYEDIIDFDFLFNVKMAVSSYEDSESLRREFGPLKLNGYVVNQKTGLSTEQRHIILWEIINSGRMTRNDVLRALEGLISYNENNPNMRIAERKWKEDKEFVLEYDKDTARSVELERLARKYRR